MLNETTLTTPNANAGNAPKTPSFAHRRYTRIQTIALGEEASLYGCFDSERDERVLLRVFRTQSEAEQSYILTEAAALAKLDSPHIARLYDVNITADNEPYIAFEDVQNIPLENLSPTHFSEPAFIAGVAASLLKALAPIHAQMRTLLCVSPSSARIAGENDASARIALDKWTPLFSARAVRAAFGAHNRYAAPEIAAGAHPDARADLYSVGVTLYEVVTGRSFEDIALVESSGMTSHLVLKSIRERAPLVPDALAQWLYGLVERERSMRFFSARESLEYLVKHGLATENDVSKTPPSAASLAPVNPIGLESAFAAIVNIQSPFAESPALEISGEPGLGKTMFLNAVAQSRLQSSALLRHKILYVPASRAAHLPKRIDEAIEKGEPTLFLVDDAEQMPEAARAQVKERLKQEETLLVGVRVVATHRSQLARLAPKPLTLTLSNFAPSHLPLFCAETLGRCAFTPEMYRRLYARTKGHPLTLALVLREMARAGEIQRSNRIWSEASLRSAFDNPSQSNAANPSETATEISLPEAALSALRALPDEARRLLTATLAAQEERDEILRLLKNSMRSMAETYSESDETAPVSLHVLAEMLDVSTQKALRALLPLVFDGYIAFHNSSVRFTHEVFREAAAALAETSAREQFRAAARAIFHARYAAALENAAIVENAEAAKTIARGEINGEIKGEANDRTSTRQDFAPPEQAPDLDAAFSSLDSEPPLSLLDFIVQGESALAAAFRKSVETAALHQDVPYLIESVPGAYREEIAAIIHAKSERRSSRPFHAVSCADFSPDELETYLFGAASEEGLLALSDGGTVFIDDIASAPTALQSRIARAAQPRKKSAKPSVSLSSAAKKSPDAAPDARIVVGFAVTNNERAESAMRAGKIHPDLFFAVSALRVAIPALNDRKEDAPLLAQCFAAHIAAEYGVPLDLRAIPPRFWNEFSRKTWIADATELEAAVRAFVLQFDPAHSAASLLALEEQLFGAATPASIKTKVEADEAETKGTERKETQAPASEISPDGILSIDDAQKKHILRALEITGGNKTKAAEMLKIKRTTLLARMKKFGLMP
jgi:DNA-binding NtrC family response regulator